AFAISAGFMMVTGVELAAQAGADAEKIATAVAMVGRDIFRMVVSFLRGWVDTEVVSHVGPDPFIGPILLQRENHLRMIPRKAYDRYEPDLNFSKIFQKSLSLHSL